MPVQKIPAPFLIALAAACSGLLSGCASPGGNAQTPQLVGVGSTTTTTTTATVRRYNADGQALSLYLPNQNSVSATPSSIREGYTAVDVKQQGTDYTPAYFTDTPVSPNPTQTLFANFTNGQSGSRADFFATGPTDVLSPNSSIYISDKAGLTTLTDAKYGVFYVPYNPGSGPNNNPNGATVGAFFGGAHEARFVDLPNATSSPGNFTATYRGSFIGFSMEDGTSVNAQRGLIGDVALTANFDAKTVNGRVNNMQTATAGGGVAATGTDLLLNATITPTPLPTFTVDGTRFSGTVDVVQANTNTPATTVQSSNLTGGFYNSATPTAGTTTMPTQAAGALTVRTTTNPTNGNNVPTTVYGAFGAKR